jgi:SP family facilitated glucose transporter-like MFS transporter 8
VTKPNVFLSFSSEQKFSGVSCITSYATLIFAFADNARNDYVQTIVLGFVRLFTTLISIFLVKYFKRRPLLITSGLCMSVSTGLLGAFFLVKEKYGGLEGAGGGNGTAHLLSGALSSHAADAIPLFCITAFMFFSQIGFGVLPFFMVVELLPSDVRSVSCSLAYGFCQLSQFLAVKTFLNMLDSLGTYGTFWFYSAVSFSGALFVTFCVPETSNLHAAQIEKLFEKKRGAESSAESSSPNSDEDDDEPGPATPLLSHHPNHNNNK